MRTIVSGFVVALPLLEMSADQFIATVGVARLILQTRKLWVVPRPTVARVTFDLPECKEP